MKFTNSPGFEKRNIHSVTRLVMYTFADCSALARVRKEVLGECSLRTRDIKGMQPKRQTTSVKAEGIGKA